MNSTLELVRSTLKYTVHCTGSSKQRSGAREQRSSPSEQCTDVSEKIKTRSKQRLVKSFKENIRIKNKRKKFKFSLVRKYT